MQQRNHFDSSFNIAPMIKIIYDFLYPASTIR